LLDMLRDWKHPETKDMTFAYVKEHLEDWPPSIRLYPVYQPLRYEALGEKLFRLCKELDLNDFFVQSDFFLCSINKVEMSVRANNALVSEGFLYIAELAQTKRETLRFPPVFGRKVLRELSEILEKNGGTFGMVIPNLPPKDFLELYNLAQDRRAYRIRLLYKNTQRARGFKD